MSELVETLKPLTLTWLELVQVMAPLHMFIKADLDSLHDIWKFGAPIPQSRILNPKDYDERLVQKGNYEERIIFPRMLAKWIVDVSKRRGFHYDEVQALALTQGKAIYQEKA
jgi:hypothetical protein